MECPQCHGDQLTMTEELQDEDGHIEETIYVCGFCGHIFDDPHWIPVTY